MVHIARVFESRKQLDKALSIYRQVANLNPDDTEVRDKIIQILVNAGRVEEAVQEMDARARELREEGKLPEAIHCYQQILDLDPQRDDIRVDYIQTVLSQDEVDEATLSQCLEEIGGLVQEGSSELALQCLEDLRARFPDNLPVLEKIYDFYRSQNRDREADGLAFDLAQNYLDAGNFQMALDWIEPLVRRGGESLPIALSLKATICRDMGEPGEALQAHYQIIDFLEKAGQQEEALSYYEPIFEIDAQDLDAHERYIRSLVRMDKTEELQEEIERLLPILRDPDSPQKALQALDTLIELTEPTPQLLLERASLLERRGDDGEARDMRLRVVDLYLSRQETEAALEIIDQLQKTDPHDLLVIEKRADLQIQLGRRDEALECYRSLVDLHREQGSKDAELDVLLKISEMDPENLDILQQILDLYDSLENKRDARELRASMAKLYIGREDYGKALEICESILSDEPADLAALELSVRVLEELGDDEPYRARALQLADAYRKRGDHAPAEQLLEALREKFPDDAEVLSRQAMALCDREAWDDALPVIEQLLELHDRDGHQARSVKLLRQIMGRSDRLAEALFGQWVDLCFATGTFPDQWSETVALIDRLVAREPVDPLLESLESMVARLPGFEPLRARHIEILQGFGLTERAMQAELDWARTCDRLGDYPSAAGHYQAALDAEPDNIDLQMEFLHFRARTDMRDGTGDLASNLADLFESQGLVAQAIHVLDTGIRLEPERGDLRRRVLALEDMVADSDALRNRLSRERRGSRGRGTARVGA